MASWCMAASRCETLDDLAACGDLSQRTAVPWRATASRPIALDAPALESTTSSTRTCARAQVKAACTLALDARERNATTLIRTHAYTHERLNACEPCAWRRLVPCASAALYASRLAPWRCLTVLRSYASAALRAWRLGGLRFGGASHLAPQRRFALRLSVAPQPLATPFALRLDGVLRFVPRRCLASRASTALCALRLDGARAPGVFTVPADPDELSVQADSTTPAL